MKYWNNNIVVYDDLVHEVDTIIVLQFHSKQAQFLFFSILVDKGHFWNEIQYLSQAVMSVTVDEVLEQQYGCV